MKREEIIRDIHGLDAELAALEEQSGLLSADFYYLKNEKIEPWICAFDRVSLRGS